MALGNTFYKQMDNWHILDNSISTLLIIILSIASYRYIEKPFRTKNFSKGLKAILEGLLIIIFSALFLIGLNNPLRGKLYLGDRTKDELEPPYFEDGSITQENCMDWDSNKTNINEVIENCLKFKKDQNKLYGL